MLCFVEDDLTTRPDMSGLSWGMLWDIRWDLTVFRNIRVDVANLQKESDMMSSGEFINMVLVNLLLVIRTDTDRLAREVRRIAKVYEEPQEPIKHFKIKVCSRCLSLSSCDQDSLTQPRRSKSH